MDIDKVLSIAAKNDRKVKKELAATSGLLSTKFSAPKKEVKAVKGVQAASVRAFLEKKEREEKEKAERELKAKEQLLKNRQEAHNGRKAHAMASRTKDNLKIFEGCREKATVPDQRPMTQTEHEVDLKHLFTKNDPRKARPASEHVPNLLEVMKEREKQRKLAEIEKEKQRQVEKELNEKSRTVAVADKAREDRQKLRGRDSEPISSSSSGSSQSQFKIPKKSQPPPLSYQQLIAMAEQSPDPTRIINNEQPVRDPLPESGRLLTKEEKERLQRRQTKEYQDWLNKGGPPPACMSTSKKSSSKRDSEISQRQESSSSTPHASNKTNIERTVSRVDHKAGNVQSLNRDSVRTDTQSSVTTVRCDTKTNTTATKQHAGSEKAVSSSRNSRDVVKNSSSVDKLRSVGNNRSSPSTLKDNQTSVPPVEQRVSSNTSSGSNNTNQSSELSNLGDLGKQLIERLKQQRREMLDRGDAVPSLNDMIQDLLNNLTGSTSKSESKRDSAVNNYSSQATTGKVNNDNKSLSSRSSSSRVPDSDKKQINSTSNGQPSSRFESAQRSSESKANQLPRPAVERTQLKINSPSSSSSSSQKKSLSASDPKHSLESMRPPKKEVLSRGGSVNSSSSMKPKSTWDQIRERTQASRPKPVPEQQSRKRRIESDDDDDDDDNDDSSLEEDEDEDDDMDGFIDDGCDDNASTDYSFYIRKLFGYDKRRYINERDDDLRDMEASYSQITKEEARSAKLGLLEDLEDMRKEEEENKRKLAKMKAKKSRLK